MQGLVSWTKIFLFATVITPLIVTTFTLYPFVFGKMVFLRSVTAIVAALIVLYGLLALRGRGWKISFSPLRNPLVLAVTAFMLSAFLSTIFALNSYRAFFGEPERGEGLYGILIYLILFLAMFFFFNKENWQLYFRLGLVVGAAVIAHVFLRYLEIAFPFALGSTRQPGSFLGNPALVASFITLLFAYVVLVYRNSNGFWKYFSLATGIAGLTVLGLLGVRGALVGIAAGALILAIGSIIRTKKPWLKWGPIFLIGALLFLGVLVRFTPASLWEGVPTLNRISDFSFESASVQTRLLSLEVSWNAFRERPIFGWGPENYSVAYNKYYNPSYAIYAEDWFDRAHNKILDILVMQGIVGIISYLGVFVALFYVLRKTEVLRDVSLPLSAILVAYFVQNLFTFDHINSYLPLFIILSFCAFSYREKRLNGEEGMTIPKIGRPLLAIGAAVVIFFAVYSLYRWNATPLFQAWRYVAVLREEPTAEKVLRGAENFLEPYNFYEKDLRTYFMQLILNSEDLKDTSHPLFSKAFSALEEVAAKEPHDLKLMVRLSEAYNDLAKTSKDNTEFFKRSIEFIERGEELSPRRQAIRGVHALLLSGEGKHNEAIEFARETLALEPRAAKSHYYLGMALTLALEGKEEGSENIKREALKEFSIALDHARELARRGDYVLFLEGDFQNMMIVYKNLDVYGELFNTYRIAEEFFPDNLLYHRLGLIAVLKQRDVGEIVRIALRIKKLDPSSADDMDVIIDLAEKERWNILDNL